jgi:2-phosphosulfolactate phosphatase
LPNCFAQLLIPTSSAIPFIMPAPDAPQTDMLPAPLARPTHVHFSPAHIEPTALRGSITIVIDALRASTTIATALHAKPKDFYITLTVQDAINLAAKLEQSGADVVLGGERGGKPPPTFHLGNSPTDYTSARINNRTLVFSSTNGTASLLAAAHADLVLVGAMCNLHAVVQAVAADTRPVHILCAGTHGQITMEDILTAGAYVSEFVVAQRSLSHDDSPRIAIELFASTHTSQASLVRLFSESLGGRNLTPLGLGADIQACATLNTLTTVPKFQPLTSAPNSIGRITSLFSEL